MTKCEGARARVFAGFGEHYVSIQNTKHYKQDWYFNATTLMYVVAEIFDLKFIKGNEKA